MAAIGHQAAADEGDIRQRIEKQQLTHGVAQQHLVAGLHGFSRGAAASGQPFTDAQLMDRVEAFGVTWHQNQQCIRLRLQQLAMGGEDDLVFTGMGAGSDPDRSSRCLPLLAQRICALQQFGIDLQVEFDRAGDFHTARASAQIEKALCLGLGLHGDQRQFAEHRCGEFAKARIAACRALGKARIGQGYGNVALGALMDVVRPQLGFHHHG